MTGHFPSPAQPRRGARLAPTAQAVALITTLGAALLAGCAGGPSPGPSGPPASAADQRAAAPAGLSAEQQWLQQWFGGTPVEIASQRDGTLRVDVPMAFAFDPGQPAIKKPLAAVLDRVAESLRRRELLVVAVAPPAEGDAALAQRRTAAVVRYLGDRGVQAARVSVAPAAGPALGLRLAVNPG
jgi:outer membrane protein OmpA-like peptidoglycan-associated protein